MSISRQLALAASLLVLPQWAFAGSSDFLRCAMLYPHNPVRRLNCFDNVKPEIPVSQLGLDDGGLSPAAMPIIPSTTAPVRSYLTRAWNLDDMNISDESRLGRLQPHKQNYLIVRKTSFVNQQPHSPGIGNNTLTPNDFDPEEIKYQLSVKADIGTQKNIDWNGLKTFRLWGTYTQQSSWQIFNTRNSSPFRETNYEPELIATFGTVNQSGLKLINLGWVHQSNGRTQPESRSWNRIYLQGGWEWNDRVSFLGRAWWRVPEDPLKDDNPDIVNYLGRGDLVLRWEPGDKSQSVALLLRNNLARTANRGFLQLDWALPVNAGDSARIHLQFTTGYGESLIDYNHTQHTIGLGFSFREW